MPMPRKFASSKAVAMGRCGGTSTRAAVEEIRRSTGAFLSACHSARKTQARKFLKGLHKAGVARKQVVREMMMGLRETRQDIAHEMSEVLQAYMQTLHAAVERTMREADQRLMQIGKARRKAAKAQARSLARGRENMAEHEHENLRRMTAERERATQQVQQSLQRFSDSLHLDVADMRRNLRDELGFDQPVVRRSRKRAKVTRTFTSEAQAKSKAASSAKPKAPVKAKAASKAKPKTQAAKTPAKAKAALHAKPKAPAKAKARTASAKPKIAAKAKPKAPVKAKSVLNGKSPARSQTRAKAGAKKQTRSLARA
jgi:hypothetical protein